MAKPRRGLLDLPPESRLEIYHYFLDPIEQEYQSVEKFGPSTYIYWKSRYHLDPHNVAILRINRLVHEEVKKLLLSGVLFSACIAADHITLSPSMSQGNLAPLHFWPFVSELFLWIILDEYNNYDSQVLNRTKRFVKDIEYGKYLKKFTVRISTDGDCFVPAWLPGVVEMLKGIRVRGEVAVSMDQRVSVWQPLWKTKNVDERLRTCEALSLELECAIKGDEIA